MYCFFKVQIQLQFLSSIGLGFGTRIGNAHVLPIPALDKDRFPRNAGGETQLRATDPEGPEIEKKSFSLERMKTHAHAGHPFSEAP